MTNLRTTQKPNPLANFMRKPKLLLKLPSNGAYWPQGSLLLSETKEIPVYSMTAKDELIIKSPDALLNGQGIVDVIQSCVPSVKDAWKTPNIDLDAILIAIRIATYGNIVPVKYVEPVTALNKVENVDLTKILDYLTENDVSWDDAVVINDELTCYVRPLTFKHISMTTIKSFETQRLMESVNNDQIPDDKKLEIFNQSFKVMTSITLDLVGDAIDAVDTPAGAVTDRKFIREFLENADKTVFQKVQDHISTMKDKYGIQPIEVTASPEQIEKGVPEKFNIELSVISSDFFNNDNDKQ